MCVNGLQNAVVSCNGLLCCSRILNMLTCTGSFPFPPEFFSIQKSMVSSVVICAGSVMNWLTNSVPNRWPHFSWAIPVRCASEAHAELRQPRQSACQPQATNCTVIPVLSINIPSPSHCSHLKPPVQDDYKRIEAFRPSQAPILYPSC